MRATSETADGRGRPRWRARIAAATVLAAAVLATAATSAGAAGFQDFSYAGVVAPTADKPQSKVWVNDGFWWASLWNQAAGRHEIYRLDWATRTPGRRPACRSTRGGRALPTSSGTARTCTSPRRGRTRVSRARAPACTGSRTTRARRRTCSTRASRSSSPPGAWRRWCSRRTPRGRSGSRSPRTARCSRAHGSATTGCGAARGASVRAGHGARARRHRLDRRLRREDRRDVERPGRPARRGVRVRDPRRRDRGDAVDAQDGVVGRPRRRRPHQPQVAERRPFGPGVRGDEDVAHGAPATRCSNCSSSRRTGRGPSTRTGPSPRTRPARR